MAERNNKTGCQDAPRHGLIAAFSMVTAMSVGVGSGGDSLGIELYIAQKPILLPHY